MSNFKHYRDHVGASVDKPFKSTLWKTDRMLLGLNCLAPGQEQRLHDHAGQDKFYYVVEGAGVFTVGDERRSASAGEVVWAPSGVAHGVTNTASDRLVLLVGIAPFERGE